MTAVLLQVLATITLFLSLPALLDMAERWRHRLEQRRQDRADLHRISHIRTPNRWH